MTELERLREEGAAAWRDMLAAMPLSARLKWEKWMVLQIAYKEAKQADKAAAE